MIYDESSALMNGISALIKRLKGTCAPISSAMCGSILEQEGTTLKAESNSHQTQNLLLT